VFPKCSLQLRKNCNHPDLITAQVEGHTEYPSGEELIEQCGKFKLMDRLLTRLKAEGHKVNVPSMFPECSMRCDIP
jgi:ATP-dependent DNA helicase